MKHELKMLPPEENFRTVRILEQLARTNRALAELKGYAMFYRIIAKKMRTHELKSNTVRKFQDKYGAKLQYATEKMEERI